MGITQPDLEAIRERCALGRRFWTEDVRAMLAFIDSQSSLLTRCAERLRYLGGDQTLVEEIEELIR